jgi:DNA invertase Pin-like site-specific DNA recombinase
MRVALYARVFTDSQEAHGTISSQLEVLRSAIADAGHVVVGEFRETLSATEGPRRRA